MGTIFFILFVMFILIGMNEQYKNTQHTTRRRATNAPPLYYRKKIRRMFK